MNTHSATLSISANTLIQMRASERERQWTIDVLRGDDGIPEAMLLCRGELVAMMFRHDGVWSAILDDKYNHTADELQIVVDILRALPRLGLRWWHTEAT